MTAMKPDQNQMEDGGAPKPSPLDSMNQAQLDWPEGKNWERISMMLPDP